MPHYKNGQEAKIGDLVRGFGYNIKHEIIGKVVNVRAGESCTLSVACISEKSQIFSAVTPGSDKVDLSEPFKQAYVAADIEYGDTKGFEPLLTATS